MYLILANLDLHNYSNAIPASSMMIMPKYYKNH